MYPILAPGSYHRSGGAFTVSGSGDIAPDVAGGIFGGDTLEKSLVGGLIGLIVLIVVATLFITAEYRRGLIRVTLAASPRRGRVLAAKAVVIGAVTFVTGLAATAISVPVSRHILSHNGNYLLPVSPRTELSVIVGTAALLAVAAVAVLALGTVLRRSAGAVTSGIGLLVLPYILANAVPASGQWLMRLTPAAAFAVQQTIPAYPQVSNAYNVANGFYPLSAWAGFAVLCAWAALALGLAFYLLRRRDA
jgi:ABC-type transport system involved in multi-copper enzyme maturation permease subunit